MDPTARQRGVERNVRLYPLYQALFNAYCWMPVFFLYFSEHLPLAQVLQLEAIYYVAVVSLEVPSGYFSDVIGRRPTLLISTSSLVLAYVLFFWGGSFAVFAAAQVCLAAGIAFNSGTDTALHFDSLIGLGRSAEYGAREAAAHRNALVARSLAALAGGLIGAWQLHFTYGLSALAALGALGVVVMMTEPSHGDDDPPRRFGFVRQVTACLRQLRKRALAWLFTFAVLMTVINHIPYELYQPYLDLLISERDIRLPGDATPMVTGAGSAPAHDGNTGRDHGGHGVFPERARRASHPDAEHSRRHARAAAARRRRSAGASLAAGDLFLVAESRRAALLRLRARAAVAGDGAGRRARLAGDLAHQPSVCRPGRGRFPGPGGDG
ncbi:MAG: MFS transporter [Planctomycetota bacterium]